MRWLRKCRGGKLNFVKKYRMYIDESGTHNYTTSDEIGERYLGLTGVIIDEETNKSILHPLMYELRGLLSDDPDQIPILHRNDIVRQEKHFIKLRDPKIKEKFEAKLETLFKDLNYTLCTVVLDKKEHFSKYEGSAKHPYHYCLELLLERYEMFLRDKGVGDVMAETRGKQEDLQLKFAYNSFYYTGTFYCKPDKVQKVFTSKQIKLENKKARIDGLSLADLLAHPSKMDVLHENKKIEKVDDFGKRIISLIQDKYFKVSKSNLGKKVIEGYGKKFVPKK